MIILITVIRGLSDPCPCRRAARRTASSDERALLNRHGGAIGARRARLHEKGHSSVLTIPVPVKKHSSGEEDPWEDTSTEHQIRGWRAVSAAGLRGKGLPRNN